jgi:hypothetical protein
LRFNSDFEPLLEHLGIHINVETLSTGEKKRVDLAVLISIIRMLKRKYPSLNIFMLDEVLSSIDGDGIYDIIGLLPVELLLTVISLTAEATLVNFNSSFEDESKIGESELKVIPEDPAVIAVELTEDREVNVPPVTTLSPPKSNIILILLLEVLYRTPYLAVKVAAAHVTSAASRATFTVST